MIAQERGNDREESVSQIDSGAKRARSSILFNTIKVQDRTAGRLST